jgi:hypothetical protein
VWTRYAELVPREGEHPWQRVLVLSAGSLVAAEIMHRTIELPFLRLGKRLVDPGRTGPLVSRRAKVLWAVGLALFGLVYVRHRIFVAFGPPNLARGKPVIASSHEPKKPAPEALTNGELESEFGLHTQREMDPWAEIDLGQPTHIGSIRIYNRADGWADEVVPLEVTTSTDGESYHVLATREEVFTQAFPWRIRVTGGPPVRYVRFHVKDKVTALCLSEVEIYGTQGMAALP